MALAGAKLQNSDELVLRQLLLSAPRKALSHQRKRYTVDDSSEIGIALQATSKRFKIDLSHAFELLCVVFWQSEVAAEQNQPARAFIEPALVAVSVPSPALPEADAIEASATTERTMQPMAARPTRPAALPKPADDEDHFMSLFEEKKVASLSISADSQIHGVLFEKNRFDKWRPHANLFTKLGSVGIGQSFRAAKKE
jgi:hypothetical protein